MKVAFAVLSLAWLSHFKASVAVPVLKATSGFSVRASSPMADSMLTVWWVLLKALPLLGAVSVLAVCFMDAYQQVVQPSKPRKGREREQQLLAELKSSGLLASIWVLTLFVLDFMMWYRPSDLELLFAVPIARAEDDLIKMHHADDKVEAFKAAWRNVFDAYNVLFYWFTLPALLAVAVILFQLLQKKKKSIQFGVSVATEHVDFLIGVFFVGMLVYGITIFIFYVTKGTLGPNRFG